MINLGNVAGVVRSVNPPLEADNITEKRYILWAQPLPGDPTKYKILYFDTDANTWVGFDDILSVVNTGLEGLLSIIGDINALNTSDTTNLVNAINSVLSGITSFINDTTVSTTTGYSSNKIEQEITTVLDTILGTVSAEYNTLKKIEDIIEGLDISAFIRFDSVQTLTPAQQATANSNIGSVPSEVLGDATEDLTTFFDDILI